MTRANNPRALLGHLSRRRRHRGAPLLLLLLALAVTGGAYAALAPTTGAEAASGPSAQTVAQGRALFLKNCATCHGLNGQGSSDGPTLVGVGAASVDFQVATGRMPGAVRGAQIEVKRNIFSPRQISAMAAYVATLGPGPSIPSKQDLDYSKADVAAGSQIYLTNCAMCHNYNGSGGALTRGKYAPSINKTTPRHIWEAMLTGPQSMPVFNDQTMTPKEKRQLIAFVRETSTQPSPGGARLGAIGPVSEGAVAWLAGLGGLIACTVWLGAKAR